MLGARSQKVAQEVVLKIKRERLVEVILPNHQHATAGPNKLFPRLPTPLGSIRDVVGIVLPGSPHNRVGLAHIKYELIELVAATRAPALLGANDVHGRVGLEEPSRTT